VRETACAHVPGVQNCEHGKARVLFMKLVLKVYSPDLGRKGSTSFE